LHSPLRYLDKEVSTVGSDFSNMYTKT